MIDLWANLSLIMFALVITGIVWVILYIFAKTFFEDFLSSIIKKLKSIKFRKDDDDDDHYVY